MRKTKQKGGVYKGKKRQRGGVYKGSKRQRGGNLAKKTKNKIIKSFAEVESFISRVAKKGKKKKNQIGGIVPFVGPNIREFGGKYGNRFGRGVDKYYL